MHTSHLMDIMKELNTLAANPQVIAPSKGDKLRNELASLETNYKKLEVPERYENVYEALCKKGKETVKILKGSKDQKENLSKLEAYVRYLHAAKGDFEGKTQEVNKYHRTFLFTSALFLALSPQYFGFILPAVFFVPIFLGTRGVKNRSINGLYMSLSIVPVALMTSFIWIRYGIYALSNYQQAVSQVLADTGRSVGVAKALVTVPPLLALLLFALASLQAYRGFKNKNLFV
ncbi:uncharacterized membrane protein (DUF485 family) [Anaerosolibacter carboniphilus]|uniref:Uncharacterized membrane protein (DUF485 family) n=1 Tax=Anaerosolibacter carboniphilus TaxID=1417629 RepID=A0A841KKR9_9FIRM|nr:hypothetical protein [Anaerosolibacter carboniphilus]MBB6214003.1 uncharacterized membrane protein (DUF485 family) [Anaerosolibacter carboniphilus]